MTRSNYLLLVFLLGMLQAMPPFSIDTSLAAIPVMARDLMSDASAVQFTLSAYVFGAAFGQLFVAPLSDRYGRKIFLIGGLIIYILTAVGCFFSTSIEILAIYRFFQGAASFAGRILPRAMARDLYDKEDAARLLSYMAVFSGMAPIFAPLIGATLLENAGWRSIFIFMAVYGLLTLILVAVFLKETLPKEVRIQLKPSAMVNNFRMVFVNRSFLSYGACMFCTMGGLMAFLVSSSSVIIIYLKHTPQEFALAFGGVMLAYSSFSFIGGRLVGWLGINRLIHLGSLLGFVSGLAMFFLAVAGQNNIWAIIVPMFGFIASLSFILPQATAGALSPFGDIAGSAMSNLGFLQTCISAVVAGIASFLYDGTQMPMVTIIAVFGMGTLFSYYGFIRPLEKEL